MKSGFQRRRLMQAMGSLAFFRWMASPSEVAALGKYSERIDTPKISLEVGTGLLAAGNLNEAGMRRVKQLGVDHVITGGPRIPWQESEIRSIMDASRRVGSAWAT